MPSEFVFAQAEARFLDGIIFSFFFFLGRGTGLMTPGLAGRPLLFFPSILELLGEWLCLRLVQHSDRGGIAGASEESAGKSVLARRLFRWYRRVLPLELGTAHPCVQIIQEVFAALSEKTVVGPLLRLELRVEQDELILHHRGELE